jgi:hypothetical protein
MELKEYAKIGCGPSWRLRPVFGVLLFRKRLIVKSVGGKNMAKLIPAAERVIRARQLIQQAREFPIPPELGKNDLSYIAGVKDLLRQARDLVKFIPQTAGVSREMKEDVKKIYEEIEQANREILYTA